MANCLYLREFSNLKQFSSAIMKRFSLLLSLMAMVFASVWAQVAPEAGKTYVIKVVSYNGQTPSGDQYLYHAGSTSSKSRIKVGSLPAVLTSSYQFTLEAESSVSGAFNFKVDGYYLPSWATSNNGPFNTVDASYSNRIYLPEAVEGKENVYYLRGYTGTTAGAYIRYPNSSTDLVCCVSSSKTTSDGALQVSFYELTTKTYTVNFSDTKDNDTFTHNYTYTWLKGQPYTITSLPYYTLSNNVHITSFGDEQSDLTGSCVPNFPFPVSSDTEKNWFCIRTRNDDSHYVKVNGTATSARNNTVTKSDLSSIRSYVESDASKWAFIKVKNTENQFYLVNKSDETKKAYLASETNMAAVTMSAENSTPFYIAPQPVEFTAFTGGFTIQPNNTNTHAIGDHQSGSLVYWSNRTGNLTELNDNGSIFRVCDADMLTAANACITNMNQSYLGAFNSTAKTALAATLSPTAFFAKYDELKAQSTSFAELDVSKIYRIWFERGTQYPSSELQTADKNGTVNTKDDDVRRIKLVATGTTPATLVKFVDKGDGQYWIQNINSQLYWGTEKEADVFNPSNPTTTPKLCAVSGTIDAQYIGKYSIDCTASGIPQLLALKDNQIDESKGQYLFAPYDNVEAGAANSNNICFHAKTSSDGTTFEPGCGVKIQAVTTYPLTIGEAKYASLCLPFSVTMPTGLTAYKVTGVQTTDGTREMTLTALTGAIPANEPIIVSATAANTYNLTINTDNTTAKSTDNWLTGATVKRTGIDDEYFALGYKALTDGEDKTAGFFKVTTQTMPANKAYLLKSKLTENNAQANVLLFNFGESTGIKQVAMDEPANAETNVYYDLNGRRVLYPAHGIYVKANGQKVFIK